MSSKPSFNMHPMPHSPTVSATRRERAFYKQKAFWYLDTFRADSKVLTLISIALDEARLWLRRSKNLDHRATRTVKSVPASKWTPFAAAEGICLSMSLVLAFPHSTP